MKIGFLVSELSGISGGMNVVIEYASRLQASGHDVVLIPPEVPAGPRSAWHPRLAGLRLQPLSARSSERFDVVLATWWRTYFDLWRLDSRIYGYLNQSLESRFHAEPHLKLLSRTTYALPLLFVTEARWLADFIRAAQPQAPVLYVQNGLSREYFPCVDAPPPRSGPLRVLVEGPAGIPFKGVAETFELLSALRPELHFETGWLTSSPGDQLPTVAGHPVTVHGRVPLAEVHQVLRAYDVLLKLSRVEGMYGPPLEMFSQGGTALTYNVTGSDEYVVHGQNALLVERHNRAQLLRYLRLLDASPAYLAHLRHHALQTARAYPDWDTSAQRLSTGLQELLGSGLDHAPLRPALEAMSTLQQHWLDDVEQLALDAGPGERALLERYRKLKRSGVGRALQRVLPGSLRRSVRAFFAREPS